MFSAGKVRERKTRVGVGILIVALSGLMALPCSAQTSGPPEDWVSKLASLETAPDLDLAALRQQAMDRIKSRADAAPLKRPPVAASLLKLPQLAADIQFDEDAAVVKPDSYRTLGRIADTLSDPSLLGYKFLIVGHTLSTGRRENNLTLSQRRADVIREVLVNTFKISPKRLQAIGLGEEQLLDAAHPSAPINQQVQIATIGSALEVNPLPVVSAKPGTVVPAKAGTHTSRRKF
jgi:outer membrane protein OmpA-like peptidoglycan-associated protein